MLAEKFFLTCKVSIPDYPTLRSSLSRDAEEPCQQRSWDLLELIKSTSSWHSIQVGRGMCAIRVRVHSQIFRFSPSQPASQQSNPIRPSRGSYILSCPCIHTFLKYPETQMNPYPLSDDAVLRSPVRAPPGLSMRCPCYAMYAPTS